MNVSMMINEITHDDLVNLFSTGLYGSEYLQAFYDSPMYHALPDASDDDCFEDKLARMLLNGKEIYLIDCYAEDKDDYYGKLPHEWDSERGMVYTITLKDVVKGLERACIDDGYDAKCFYDLCYDDAYNLDLPKAENLLQIIMFGEAIYG